MISNTKAKAKKVPDTNGTVMFSLDFAHNLWLGFQYF